MNSIRYLFYIFSVMTLTTNIGTALALDATKPDSKLLEFEKKFGSDFDAIEVCDPYFFESQNRDQITFFMPCIGDTLSWVNIILQGDKAEGLKKDQLTRFIRMRAKNDLSFLSQEVASPTEISEEYSTDTYYGDEFNWGWRAANGIPVRYNFQLLRRVLIECKVWTVGDDYPIAFHVECRLLPISFNNIDGYHGLEQAVLGYSNTTNLEESVKDALKLTIEGLGELWVEYELLLK